MDLGIQLKILIGASQQSSEAVLNDKQQLNHSRKNTEGILAAADRTKIPPHSRFLKSNTSHQLEPYINPFLMSFLKNINITQQVFSRRLITLNAYQIQACFLGQSNYNLRGHAMNFKTHRRPSLEPSIKRSPAEGRIFYNPRSNFGENLQRSGA